MSARRARGDGSVFRDHARGVWVATIELPRNPDTGRRTRRKASARTKTEAQKLLNGMRADKHTAGTVGRRDLTVGKLLADYLDHPHAGWRSETTRRVSASHAKRLTAALGHAKLAALTPSRVERFLADMAKGGYSTSTIRQTRALLRAAIRRAERDGLVSRNVADQAEAPRGKLRKPRAFTLDQVRDLLAAARPLADGDDPWWDAYVHVAVMLGLRPGELLGLSWADVDLDGGEVRVRRSLKQRPGQEPELDDLKTEQSRRTLRLPVAALAALEAHKRYQREERFRLGPAWHDHGLVFPGPDGAPASRSTVAHGFAALCERAGLGQGWTRYACRHTFVSHLSHRGVSIEEIADAAGHRDSRTTVAVYRHNMADRISTAADVWDKILPA